ncbi:MAG: hypothetical protein AAF911_12545 [Planctomycetota bacterium]
MENGTAVSGGGVLLAGVSSAPLDDQGRVAIDLYCVGCGYNLRMCDAGGRCPECGLAVGRSSVGRYLCYHEPKWVQCLAWGMNRFAVALAMVAITAVLGFVWANVAEEMPSNRVPFWPTVLIYGFLPPIAIGFGLLGLARATWPDPSPVKAEAWGSARRLTRMMFVTGVLTSVASVGVGLTELALYDEPTFITAAVSLLMLLAWLAVPVCLLLHARKLASLIPRKGLARWTLAVLLMIGSSGIVVVVLSGNWFGWLDAAAGVYERLWPAGGAGALSTYSGYYWMWSPGDPWYYHDEFAERVELAQTASWVLLGLSVLGIVPLFFVYWSALHTEAAKAKATWAASPWQKKEVAAGEEHTPSV